MIRRLGFAVSAPAVLEQIAAHPRPLGLRGVRTRYALLRETFFDTRDGTLAENATSLCLRVEATGGQTLELVRTESVMLGGLVELDVLTTPVVNGGMYATLHEDSELATALRDLVDPLALRPILALDIDREIQSPKRGLWGKKLYTVSFDRILAHRRGATRALQEIVLTEPAVGPSSLEAVGRALERRWGLVQEGRSTLQRALVVLDEGEAGRPEAPREAHLALLVLREGSVGLVPEARGFTVPSSRGSGDEMAASLAGEILGTTPASRDLELAGFAPSRGNGADLEVWLHQCPYGTEFTGEALWIPLEDLLERVGGPGLRDPALVAALLLLVRSDAGQRLLADYRTERRASRPLPLPARAPQTPPGEDPEDFLDVELGILAFNQRVLEMAEDPVIPLLERFRFLSIFAGATDEFFVVRVGRLKGEREKGNGSDGIDLTATELLDLTAVRARVLTARQYACFRKTLLPALAERGVLLRTWAELGPDARSALSRRFESEIFPLLTPQALSPSPGQPFPRLESLGLSLAVVLRGPGAATPKLAHVSIPATLPRFFTVPGGRDIIALEALVAAHAESLFPALRVSGVHAFRISRMGAVEIDEDATASLLAAVEDEVQARPYKPVVRIEVERSMPPEVLAFLLRELRQERGSESAALGRPDVFEVDGPLDLRSLAQLSQLDLPDASYRPFVPLQPWPPERPVFDILKEGDRLVYHPYESFDGSVGRFLREASIDPDVAAIKLTLYRTGRTSPFGDTLLEALRNGKEVSVFVELKARFDEESNIQWTRRLTEAGGHVVYGVVGFKTHAKAALVVRREGGGVRRYVHVGTGNYNATTAWFYTDLGLLSADPELGADLNDFFNELTGSAGPPVKQYRRLLVAPNSLAQRLSALIEREVAHAAAGRPARIQAKLNGLTDRPLVRALYHASQRGVETDLIVRAVCTLRPGVPGLSTGIRVRSILGRFLEHARIYYFENGGAAEYFIASADWRKRNLRKRVEMAVPVRAPDACARLRSILDAELNDPRAWTLQADGTYVRRSDPGVTAQEWFLSGTQRSLSSGPTRP